MVSPSVFRLMTARTFVGCRPHFRGWSRSRSTASTKSFTLIGLLWYASNPASVILCRSAVITDAVMAMMGIPRVACSARSRRSASIPSIPGSRMSIRIRLGCRSWARRTPSSPVSASMISYPLNVNTSRTSLRFLSLSSTTRISSFATAHRDRERERRTHAHLTLDPDPPAVELDELPAEGQPKARSLRFLLRRPHLAELFEDLLLIVRRDADPGVADGDLHKSILWHRANVDTPSLRGELDRIRY